MDETADPITPPPRPARPWTLFETGAGSYAVGLEAVAEVVEVGALVRLPLSPPGVLGLCALRREVIPVVGLDPVAREADRGANPGPAAAGSKLMVLVLKTARGAWAVRVTAERTSVLVEPLDEPAGPGGGARPAVLGSVRKGDQVYTAIDPEATWKGVREGVEEWYRNHRGRDKSAEAGEPRGSGGAGRGSVAEEEGGAS